MSNLVLKHTIGKEADIDVEINVQDEETRNNESLKDTPIMRRNSDGGSSNYHS